MDPSRLRQIVMHLLTFAQRSAGAKGTIEVTINLDSGFAELVIADSGSVLTDSDQARLFEPYQGTAHSSPGLGLALIRRFVLEAGGSIVRRQGSGLNCFHLSLPLVKHTSQGTQS
jgi:signal transduction histidine kinase